MGYGCNSSTAWRKGNIRFSLWTGQSCQPAQVTHYLHPHKQGFLLHSFQFPPTTGHSGVLHMLYHTPSTYVISHTLHVTSHTLYICYTTHPLHILYHTPSTCYITHPLHMLYHTPSTYVISHTLYICYITHPLHVIPHTLYISLKFLTVFALKRPFTTTITFSAVSFYSSYCLGPTAIPSTL
jgi:hypothetical protein